MRIIPKTALFAAVFQLTHPLSFAGTFATDFNSGTPVGMTLHGTTVVESTGGVGDSGTLKITKAINSQSGAAILEPIDADATVYGFDMRFKARIGGGSPNPGDGFSVVFGPDIPDGPFGEEGVGAGIRVAFDIYDNGGGEAPSIDVKLGDTVLATRRLSVAEISTWPDFADVQINFQPTGLMSVAYKGAVIHTNIPVAGYVPTAGRFAFGGRTGGANANQFIDDLQITTFLQPQTAIVQQPRSITGVISQDVTFDVQITNPDGVTYQWFRNGTAIPGATGSSLVVSSVTAADSGNRYRVQVTGPNNSVTSQDAILTTASVPAPTAPKISSSFEGGATPTGSTLVGTAFVDTTGGVGESGVLKLTIAEISQAGAIIFDDPDAGASVYG